MMRKLLTICALLAVAANATQSTFVKGKFRFPSNYINGDSLDDLFLDKDCPQIDARNYLSSYCQDQLVRVNATLGITVDLLNIPPAYSINSKMEQSLVVDWCQTCGEQISLWMDAYLNSSDLNCKVNAEILRTVCTIDPKSNIECIDHIGNYALPTFDSVIRNVLLLGPTAAQFPQSMCWNASCCEIEALDSIISLGKAMNNVVITEAEQGLTSLKDKMKTLCAGNIAPTCDSLLVKPTTAAPQVGVDNKNGKSGSGGSSSLSSGSRAGLVIGVVCVVGVSAGAGFVLYKKRQAAVAAGSNNKNWFAFSAMEDEEEDEAELPELRAQTNTH